MSKKRFSAEEIINKLRRADVLISQGQTVTQVELPTRTGRTHLNRLLRELKIHSRAGVVVVMLRRSGLQASAVKRDSTGRSVAVLPMSQPYRPNLCTMLRKVGGMERTSGLLRCEHRRWLGGACREPCRRPFGACEQKCQC